MVICKVLKFGKLCVNISKRKDKSVRAWEWFCHKGKNCFSHIYLQLLESITWKTRNSLENLGGKLLWLVILISDIGCFVHFIQEIQIPFYCLLKNGSTLAEFSNATSWMGIVLEKTFSQRIWKNLGFSEESVLLLSMLIHWPTVQELDIYFKEFSLVFGMCCIKLLQNVCCPTKHPDKFSACK